MAGKPKKTAGQESLMEDVWAVVASSEKDYTVAERISLLRTSRKGVWRVRVDVFSVVDGKPNRKLSEVVREWPNSQVTTLEALLLQMVTEAYNRLEEAIQVLRDQARF